MRRTCLALIACFLWVAPGRAEPPARGYLGLYARSNRNVVESRNAFEGLTVTQVVENSPAEAAGLKEGDILLEANGKPLTDPNQILDLAEGSPIGTRVKIRFERDKNAREAELVTVPRVELDDPAENAAPETWIEKRKLGFEFAAPDAEANTALGLMPHEGVRVERVAPKGPMGRSGITAGAVISHMDGEIIHSGEDLLARIEASQARSALLRVAEPGGKFREKKVVFQTSDWMNRKIKIPLLFGYERDAEKTKVSVPILLSSRERHANYSRYRLFWFFVFERGASDELLEVAP